MTHRTQYGAWIDNAPNTVTSAPFWKKMKSMGFDLGAIMIDTARIEWDPIYSKETFGGAVRQAIEHDASASGVVWPVPRKDLIDAMVEDLAARFLGAGVVGVEGDLEHLWHPDYLDHHSFGPRFREVLAADTPKYVIDDMARNHGRPGNALERAGVYLAYKFRWLEERFDAWTAITTHLGHREMTSRAIVGPRVCYLNGQFYSTETNWRKEHVPWNSLLGPHNIIKTGVSRVLRVPGMFHLVNGREKVLKSSRLGIGLAGWNVKWAGRSILLALAIPFLEALRIDPRFIMYWSSKWFIAGRRSSSAEQIQVAAVIGRLNAIARGFPRGEAIKKIEGIIAEEDQLLRDGR